MGFLTLRPHFKKFHTHFSIWGLTNVIASEISLYTPATANVGPKQLAVVPNSDGSFCFDFCPELFCLYSTWGSFDCCPLLLPTPEFPFLDINLNWQENMEWMNFQRIFIDDWKKSFLKMMDATGIWHHLIDLNFTSDLTYVLLKVKVKYSALTPSLFRQFFFPILAQILGAAHHFCQLYLTSTGLWRLGLSCSLVLPT